MIQFLPAFRHVALNHREVALLIAIIVLLVEGHKFGWTSILILGPEL